MSQMFKLLANDSIKIIFSYLPKLFLFSLCCVNNDFNDYLKLYIQNRKTTISDLINIKWLHISTIVILSQHNPIIEREVGSRYTLALPSTYLGESVTHYITLEDGTKQYIDCHNESNLSLCSVHNTINLLKIPKIIFDNAIDMYYQFNININIGGQFHGRKAKRQRIINELTKKWEKRDLINTSDLDYYITGYYDSNHLVFKTDKYASTVTGIITKGRNIIQDLKNIREIIAGNSPSNHSNQNHIGRSS